MSIFLFRETISIHALREEGDPSTNCVRLSRFNFYPRPPRGGRLRHGWSRPTPKYFYPRPPRGGRPSGLSGTAYQSYFYPRPPRGGRRGRCGCIRLILTFLSTPSARRATHLEIPLESAIIISIHALREEGDSTICRVHPQGHLFLSTPSARRATRVPNTSNSASRFLSTPSARRATPQHTHAGFCA